LPVGFIERDPPETVGQALRRLRGLDCGPPVGRVVEWLEWLAVRHLVHHLPEDCEWERDHRAGR